MLSSERLLTNEKAEALLSRRGLDDAGCLLERIEHLSNERRDRAGQTDDLRRKRNDLSARIGKAKASGSSEIGSALLAEAKDLGRELTESETELTRLERELGDLLLSIPNLPHEDVPELDPKVLWISALDCREPHGHHHRDIGERLGILDFTLASNLSGSGFAVYKGDGALLELALIRFMIDHQTGRGYLPFIPPFMAKEACYVRVGQLPKFAEQLYACERDKLYLNPTAESLLASFCADTILDRDRLPLKYCAFTTCFRREAGSHGLDSRGLVRMHQFNKVELFRFAVPNGSYDELDEMVEDAASVLHALELPYRVTLLPATELAQQSAKTVDIEVWLPGLGRFAEGSSCSNCEEYQARRAHTRYRAGENRNEYVHTLNGSGVATSRLFAAILENNLQEDGSVVIPTVLRPYMGNAERIAISD